MPYGEDKNSVVDFRTHNLCLFVEAYAVHAADTFCKETCNMRYFMFFFGGLNLFTTLLPFRALSTFAS